MTQEIIAGIISCVAGGLLLDFIRGIRKKYVSLSNWVKGTISFFASLMIFAYSVYSATINYGKDSAAFWTNIFISILAATLITVLFATLYRAFEHAYKAVDVLSKSLNNADQKD